MLSVVILSLAILTLINYYVCRSAAYPAVIFSGVWAFGLVCLLVSGSLFYPISGESLLIFLCGAVAFSVGSALGTLAPSFTISPPRNDPKKLVRLCVTVLVIAFPFYVYWLIQLVGDKPGEFLSVIHQEFADFSSDSSEAFRTPTYIFFSYVGLISIVVSLVAWIERLKITAIISVVVAVLYSVLTGGRATAIRLLVAILCIQLLTARKLPSWRAVTAVAVCSVLLFGVMAVLVHGESDATVGERIQFAGDQAIHYVGGPIIAFDRIVQNPNIVAHHMNAAMFFIETAHRLGFDVTPPSRQSDDWIPTGPEYQDNVYTMYFAYLDFGWPLCFLVLAMQGFVLSLLFKQAKCGGKVAAIIYSYAASQLILCTFSDFLMGAINPILKVWAISWAFYYLPRLRLGITLLPRVSEAK